MVRIFVKELIGRSGLSKTSGNILYEAIIDRIKENQKITLDFSGVEAFASLFFNASIGRLLKDYSPEELNERIDFINLTPVGQETLKRTIKNSAEYFGNINVRKAVDSTISELGGEENEN